MGKLAKKEENIMNCSRSFYLHRTKRNAALFEGLLKYAKISRYFYNQMLYYCNMYYEVYETLPSFETLNMKGMLNQPNGIEYKQLKWVSLTSNDVRYEIYQKDHKTNKYKLDLNGKPKILKSFFPYNQYGNTHIADSTLQMYYGVIASYFGARKAFYKDKKKFSGMPMFPHYLKKDQFYYHFAKRRAQIRNNALYLKLEPIPFGVPIPINQLPEELYNATEIKQVRFYVRTKDCIKIEMIYTKKKQEEVQQDPQRVLSIDLGVSNLAACITNDPSLPPFLLCGKQVKSINHYYNKTRAKLQRSLSFQVKYDHIIREKKGKMVIKKVEPKYMHYTGKSECIKKLGLKRELQIHNIFHTYTSYLIAFCKKNNITEIMVGENKGWKQKAKMGRFSNQKFISIPFDKFKFQLEYKCQLNGIRFTRIEESYTSKTDHLAYQPLREYGKKSTKEKKKKTEKVYYTIKNYGSRKYRGKYISSIHKILNADINGAMGIMRKKYGDQVIPVFLNNRFLCNPKRVRYMDLLKKEVQNKHL